MNTKVAKKNNKGFTLIELIVVIAIIAVLAAILAPQYLRYVEKSRIASDEQYAGELRNAVKTSCADEKAAAYVIGKTGDKTVKWSKDGITGTLVTKISADTSVSKTKGTNDFENELTTNLAGEKIAAPKSAKYKTDTYTITVTADSDAISVEGKWDSENTTKKPANS